MLIDPGRLHALAANRLPAPPRLPRAGRAPVSVLYGGAQLFRADGLGRARRVAVASLDAYAPDAETYAQALGEPLTPALSRAYARMRARLAGPEPLEDWRIDFEDGYGSRPDAEEDAHAHAAGLALGEAALAGALPPFVGVRLKAVDAVTGPRALSTLNAFFTSFAATAAPLPPGLVVTLPKVSNPEAVHIVKDALAAVERAAHWPHGAIGLELMVETPMVPFAPHQLAQAAGDRLRALHFGIYDYLSALGVPEGPDAFSHPAADAARCALLDFGAASGVRVSDGATTRLPVAPYKGEGLSPEQRAENRTVVHAAWRTHHAHVTRSWSLGFCQSWDLHPAQLVSRYVAVYAFYAERLAAMQARLGRFVAAAAQATAAGGQFDDAATGQMLLNFFMRGLDCGALDLAELEATGLGREQLDSRRFA